MRLFEKCHMMYVVKQGGRKMENIIELTNVTKQYKGKKALDEIDLSVKRGEIFGLLGPSGAGKTTMIKLLTGQISHTAGKITVNKMEEKDFQSTEFRKNIGILSDNSALYERLSIYENLKLFCRLYDAPLARIEEVLVDVNLAKDRDTAISKLSKGMKQRVLLAKALIHRPKLLFLDEPTSALDPGTMLHIHRALKKLNDAGITIFLTTHNMDEATALCNRVAFLDQGKIMELAEPKALQYKYSTHAFHIETFDGKQIKLDNHPENAEKIKQLIESNNVKSMYTDNPTLGDVFLAVTGKELV